MELRKFVLVGLAMALAAILVAVSGKSLHSAKTLRSESEASVSVSSESSCSQSVSSDSGGDSSQSSASSDSGCHQSATTSPPGAGVTSAAGAGGEAGGAQPTQQPGGGDVTQTTGAGGEVVTQQPVTGGEAGLGASDPTTFTTNPSGQQVSTVGGRTVALSNGQLVEVDASGQPVVGSSLTPTLNFQGGTWTVENGRAQANLGSRQFTVSNDAQLRELNAAGNVEPNRQFFVSGNQIFQAENPASGQTGDVPARVLDASGQPSGEVQTFSIGSDGQVVPGTTGQTILPATFSTGVGGQQTTNVGGRNLGVVSGAVTELDQGGMPVAGSNFGQNFNFGAPWAVQNGRAQANLGSRQFTIGNDGQLREFDPATGSIIQDRQFFVSGSNPFQVEGAGTGSSGGQVMARQLDGNGQLTGSSQSFTLGADGQVVAEVTMAPTTTAPAAETTAPDKDAP